MKHFIKILSGLLVFVIMLMVPAPEGLTTEAWRTAAVTLLMGIWWITEAIPIPATALLPIVLFPVLGVAPVGDATSPYAHPLIFLFMGGFIIALAMERWNLHRRIAINIVNKVGVKPSSIIIGFIIAAAFLSMWVSNTATAVMMLPIAVSVLELAENQRSEMKKNFEIVLLLCVAYACNIGGMGTLIGTPPNALMAGFMSDNYGIEIGFAQWMLVGVPLMLILLPLMYVVLTKVVYPVHLTELPGGRHFIENELKKLGTLSKEEKRVAAVFVTTAVLWMSRPLLQSLVPGLSDAGIAVAASLSFFLIPSDLSKGSFLLNWTDSRHLPWGVLILFGGGLSMASAINETGLATWIGAGIGSLGAAPAWLLIVLSVALIVFLTEMTSNTASTAAFLPIFASIAIGLGENPLLFVVPMALGASCAFMLPVATPPNAIVYGSEKLTIPEMSKAGLVLNLVSIIILSAGAMTLLSWVFGAQIGILPDWAG